MDLVTIAQSVANSLPSAEAVQAAALPMEKAVLSGANHLAAGFALGLAAIGGGFGIAVVGAATILGIARQPEQAGTLRGLMFVVAALIEGLALIAMVIGLLLAFQ